MAKKHTFRFAAGDSTQVFSGVWRLVVSGSDVYLGASKTMMGKVKVSLHASGVWVLAATQQFGFTLDGNNRRGRRWTRPPDHSLGVTRGPSIFAPHTSLGSRPFPLDEGRKRISWFPAPSYGHVVEFSLYIVKPGTPTSWDERQTQLHEFRMASGDRVVLLGSHRPVPPETAATWEAMLHDDRLKFGVGEPGGPQASSLLLISESKDGFGIPTIVDFPPPTGRACPPAILRSFWEVSAGRKA